MEFPSQNAIEWGTTGRLAKNDRVLLIHFVIVDSVEHASGWPSGHASSTTRQEQYHADRRAMRRKDFAPGSENIRTRGMT